MKPHSMLLNCLILSSTITFAAEVDGVDTFTFNDKLSSVSISASAFGEDWTGPTGLVVDDFTETDHLPADQKEAVDALRMQVEPLGVDSLADFTYRKKSDSLFQVTVRVFVFDSKDNCDKWMKRKYMGKETRQYYTPVEGAGDLTLDSKQMSKRIVAFGNVWITCGMLANGNDHLQFLEKYVARFKRAP